MFGAQVQKQARSIAERIVRPIAALGLSPNVVTLTGLALTGVAAIVIGSGQLQWGGALVLFAGIFDMFDGAVARVQQKTTPFGAFLDSTLDRYAEGFLLLGVIISAIRVEQWTNTQSLVVILAYCAAIFSLVISYTRARAESLGFDCKVGLMERPERVLLLGAGLLFGGNAWLVWVLSVLVITTGFTGLQRIAYVWRVSTHGVIAHKHD
jgi:CDP-diacylglycerol---glycerol-3-phosphate 3-phosphatidyltransferase